MRYRKKCCTQIDMDDDDKKRSVKNKAHQQARKLNLTKAVKSG